MRESAKREASVERKAAVARDPEDMGAADRQIYQFEELKALQAKFEQKMKTEDHDGDAVRGDEGHDPGRGGEPGDAAAGPRDGLPR
eukprot:6307842-Pyramimonas_sp.AAC.1